MQLSIQRPNLAIELQHHLAQLVGGHPIVRHLITEIIVVAERLHRFVAESLQIDKPVLYRRSHLFARLPGGESFVDILAGLQYVVDPGGADGGSDAVVLGLRAVVAF